MIPRTRAKAAGPKFSLLKELASDDKYPEEIMKQARVTRFHRNRMLFAIEDLGGEKAGAVLDREAAAKKAAAEKK